MILWGRTDCSVSVFTNVVRPVPDDPGTDIPDKMVNFRFYAEPAQEHAPTTIMVKGTPLTLFPLRRAGCGILFLGFGLGYVERGGRDQASKPFSARQLNRERYPLCNPTIACLSLGLN